MKLLDLVLFSFLFLTLPEGIINDEVIGFLSSTTTGGMTDG